MSEPMPTIPTQSPFTYPNPNSSASPSFTQDDTFMPNPSASPSFTQDDTFMPEPIQPMPTFTQTAFSQPAVHTQILILPQTQPDCQPFAEFSADRRELHKVMTGFQKGFWSLLNQFMVWKVAAVPTHSAFIGLLVFGSKPTILFSSVLFHLFLTLAFDNVKEFVLHSFVAAHEQDQVYDL
ncbi:hypothetical protein Tco_1262648 [Tanacetum coccineum]